MEAAKPSWAFGAGATRAEKGLAYAVSLFGICALVVGGHGLGWTWWQWLIGALLVHDLAGGVVANGLDTAKLFYHSPSPSPTPCSPASSTIRWASRRSTSSRF